LGDAEGICMPGVITCGVAEGDADGICMPGVITCGLADGDAVGICMPGVITCGLGEGDGLGLVALLVGARLVRVTVLFFLDAAFGFGFAAGFLGMTCPSCCGNTLIVSANIKANALSVRSAILKLLDRFMVPPHLVRQSEH
jgi:hypothetical protein